MNQQEAVLLVDKLEDLRTQLAELESAHHTQRVTAFMQARGAKTVKEMEFTGEAATLDLHRDMLLLRAEIRTLEDRLRIALNADEA